MFVFSIHTVHSLTTSKGNGMAWHAMAYDVMTTHWLTVNTHHIHNSSLLLLLNGHVFMQIVRFGTTASHIHILWPRVSFLHCFSPYNFFQFVNSEKATTKIITVTQKQQ